MPCKRQFLPSGEQHGRLVESVAGQCVMRFMSESKMLPVSMLNRRVHEKAAHIQATEVRKLGKKEKKDLKDEAKLALLAAEDERLPGFTLALVDTQTSPQAAMVHWLMTQEPPAGFVVDREYELKAADESKAVVRYALHPLDIDEVRQHIEHGKMPTKLAMTWDDRPISCTC